MIYQFRTGGEIYRGIGAQVVGETLERIRSLNEGRLTPAEVVRAAAEADSPLHGCFTWDTEKAAHEHHLFEARQLIRSVVIVKKEGEPPIPAFWNVSVGRTPANPDAADRYYQAAAVITRNPKEYESALKIMLRELASARKGLEQLRQLAPHGRKTVIGRAAGQVKSAHDTLADLTD